MAGQESEDTAQVAENVEILSAYQDGDLLTTLKAVLENRTEVLQQLMHWAVPDRVYASSRLLTEYRCTGAIKSFNEQNGYGFIDCRAVREKFGNDVFLHRDQRGTFEVGEQVSFVVVLSHTGKAQAFDLLPPGSKGQSKGGYGSPAPAATAKGVATTKGGGWGSSPIQPAGKGYTPYGQTANGAPAAGKGAATYGKSGGSWSQDWKSGSTGGASWGGKDSAAGGGAKGGWSQGKGASKGKEEPLEGIDYPGVTDRRWDGVLKSFNEKNGFGFIQQDELKDMFGNDVFIHHRQLGNIQVGEAVSFAVFLNKDEKPQAKDVQGADGSFQGSDGDLYAAKRPAPGGAAQGPGFKKVARIFT